MKTQPTLQIRLPLLVLSVLCGLVLVPALSACSSRNPPGQGSATPALTALADTPGVQAPTDIPAIGQATPTPGSAIGRGAGLVYRVGTGFWVLGAEGRVVHILERTNALISAEGDRALYGEENDVWLADLATGERRNLTQTADRHESNSQWWQGRPDVVVFISQRLEGQEKPPLTEGYLTVVGVDGEGYRILDDQTLIGGPTGLPALSADGQTIAYSGGTTGLLFYWDTGAEVFDPSDYGVSDAQGELRIANPSWAPDGQRLAWVVHRSSQFGIAVFDLQTRSAWMGHFYDPVGMDGFPPGVVWSPDGRWLAVVAMAADPKEMGLWILEGDRWQDRHMLGRGSNPVWSPDGDWLAFAGAPDGAEWQLWLAEAGTWELRPLGLPSDAYLAGWIRP